MTVTGNGALVAVSDAKSVTFARPAPGAQDAAGPSPGTIGLILPPPGLREIVDKTAQFIAKNGEDFEQRIAASERENTKFKFLSPKDPYNAYYRAKIDEFRGGSGVAKAEGVAAGAAAGSGAQAKAPVQPSVVLKEDDQVKRSVVVDTVLETPSAEEYTVRTPEGLTALDLDVIRLTAQFVAKNGKVFLSGLASREQNNPQFHFLKPTHSMFTFFTSLTDAYAKVLAPTAKTLKALEHDKDEPTEVLARCLRRLEWMRVQEEEKRTREDAEEKERTAMALIDWNDFVVVETVDFFDQEDAQLPEPLPTRDLVAISKADQVEEDEEEAAMEVEMDEEEMGLVKESGVLGASAATTSAPDMPAPEPQMKIVKNYKRLSQVERGAGAKGTKFVVSPITGELVDVNEMAEHMRISLIDPKWKEQREAMLAKIKDTTRATDDEIARNVSSLANTRPDIFGSAEEEISKIVAAEIERSQKSADAPEKRTPPVQVQAAPPPHPAPAPGPPPPRAPPPSQGPPPPVMGRGSFPPQRQMPPMPPGHVAVRGRDGYMPNMNMNMGPPLQQFPYRQPMPGMPPPGMHPIAPSGMMGPPGMIPMGMPPPPGMQMAPLVPHGGPPPPPTGPPPPPSGAEPPAKRARVEQAALQPEAQWLASHPGAATIKIKTISGEIEEIGVDSLSVTITGVKKLIQERVGLAPNKQKLQIEGIGFLKDPKSLAFFNVTPDTVLILGAKERGGRKK